MTKLEQLNKELEEAREKFYEARKRYNEEQIKSLNIDFKGKFLKFGDDDEPSYLYVEEMFRTKDEWTGDDTEYFLLRGFGFRYLNTEYSDSSYFEWDWMFEERLYLNHMLEQNLENIREISKDEFRETLNRALKETTEHIDKIFESKYFDKHV